MYSDSLIVCKFWSFNSPFAGLIQNKHFMITVCPSWLTTQMTMSCLTSIEAFYTMPWTGNVSSWWSRCYVIICPHECMVAKLSLFSLYFGLFSFPIKCVRYYEYIHHALFDKQIWRCHSWFWKCSQTEQRYSMCSRQPWTDLHEPLRELS